MNQFLASLTPRQAKIFYVTVFIVVLALFDRLLVGPTMSKLAAIDESIANEKTAVQSDLRFLTYKDRVQNEAKLFEQYYVEALPKEEDVMGPFLDRLDSLVKEAGLTLAKNNRSADQPAAEDKGSKDFLVYKADLEVSGSLDNVAKLMYTIDTSKEFFKILKVNLTMKKNGDVEEIKATMTVAKYIVPASNVLLASSATAPAVAVGTKAVSK